MDDFSPDDYLASVNSGEVTPPTPHYLDTTIPGSGGMQLDAPPTHQAEANSDGFDPDAFLEEARQEKYGTLPQIGLTALEGAGQGFAGPVSTLAEKGLSKLGVPGIEDQDILERQKANPIAHGVGEAAGLGAGLMTGTGEAKVMTEAGNLAREAVGLGKAAEGASYGYRVGSEAVQQAAEMAIMSGGSEVSKMLLHDPETSAESAIANVGMAAMLGAGGGAFISGAVSPLWKATAGPKVEGLLSALRNRIDGMSIALPEQIESSLNHLGVEATPEMRAALSGNPGALEKFNTLKEVQNKDVLNSISKLENDTSEAVMNKMGIHPSEVESYSENEAGHKLYETFKKEYDREYKPLAEAFERRNSEAANISTTDDARMSLYSQMLESGMDKVGTDSDFYKLYNKYGDRVLAKETIGGLDQLKTEINNSIKRLGIDPNEANVLRDIKSMIGDFQEREIGKMAVASEKAGIEGALTSGEEMVAERALTNQRYAEFAKMSDELMSHLNVGRFHGAGALAGKLADDITPEMLLKKFSFRNNADFIQFLGKNFPETLKEVQANELKKLLKPAILGAKGEAPLSIKKLSDIINKANAGSREYIDAVLPQGAKEAIESARMIQEAIPNPKSSGTAGWITKTMAKMPQSALAAVAMLTSHNPVFGYLTGEMAQLLQRSAPDAVNLAYLKFLGSNQSIKSEGFKAMVEFIHNTAKGQNLLSKATSAVFESGAKVLGKDILPAKADLDKLDKAVTKMQAAPNEFYKKQTSDVGHYLPEHQTGLTQVSGRALAYLASIKPHPFKAGPLDTPIEPSQAETARYNRALEIAQQPAIVMKHVKDGTIQITDIKDMGAMYPGLYKKMAEDLSIKMTHADADKDLIPYKTKIGLSLFLGQPLDGTMTPEAIQSAQAVFMPKPNEAPQGGQPKGNTDKLGKNVKNYQTPDQASEQRKMSRK